MSNPTVVVETIADMHKHLRETPLHAALIELGVRGGADVFGLQPNTDRGLITAQQARDYKAHAEAVAPVSPHLGRPTMVPFIMITEETTPKEIDACIAFGVLDGKVYPKWRTTKSERGVERYFRLIRIFKHCGQVGMRVHFHPELPNSMYINRDAEYQFLPLVEGFLQETGATIVWEHGTDGRCVPAWIEMAKSGRFWVTLTAHHLLAAEDEVFGDVRGACKPPIKTEMDRLALVALVAADHSWVMAGGDDAFHPKAAKHVSHGRCACGAFTGPFLLPLYAHALERLLKTHAGIEQFVNFTSRNARRAYGLPDGRKVMLARNPQQVPLEIPVGPEVGMPFWAGQTINWRIVGE